MGQEKYFNSVQEADQFLEDMAIEIFRYSNVSSPYVEVPVFICFDFMITEGLKIIESALLMSEKSLHTESTIFSSVVKEYLDLSGQLWEVGFQMRKYTTHIIEMITHGEIAR